MMMNEMKIVERRLVISGSVKTSFERSGMKILLNRKAMTSDSTIRERL